MPNEADTCRRYVVPKLQAAGWDNEPYRINEQVTFTDDLRADHPEEYADFDICSDFLDPFAEEIRTWDSQCTREVDDGDGQPHSVWTENAVKEAA
jgi:hypothetical protein